MAKVRVKRNGKLVWVQPEHVGEGEETFPIKPPGPRPPKTDAVEAAKDAAEGADPAVLFEALTHPASAIHNPEDVAVMLAEKKRLLAEVQALEASMTPVSPPPSPGGFPIRYYNPITPHERFRIGDSARFARFYNGFFTVNNPTEEASVRNVLAFYGKGMTKLPDGTMKSEPNVDRWKGDDTDYQWTCAVADCRFTTSNRRAWDDHRRTKQGHGE